MLPQKIKVEINAGRTGLYFATSRDIPGLLVAAENREKTVAKIGLVLESLCHATGVAVPAYEIVAE